MNHKLTAEQIEALNDDQRDTWALITAFCDRAAKMRAGEVALGDATAQPMGAWTAWLDADELELAAGQLAHGTFVHITADIRFGMKGRKKKGETAQRGAANKAANALPPFARTPFPPVTQMLQRIALLRSAAAAAAAASQ